MGIGGDARVQALDGQAGRRAAMRKPGWRRVGKKNARWVGARGLRAAGGNRGRSGALPKKTAARAADLREQLGSRRAQRGPGAASRARTPLIHPSVTAAAVAAVVADWTGIPVGRMVRDEAQSVLHLADHAGAPRHRPAPRAGHGGAPRADRCARG